MRETQKIDLVLLLSTVALVIPQSLRAETCTPPWSSGDISACHAARAERSHRAWARSVLEQARLAPEPATAIFDGIRARLQQVEQDRDLLTGLLLLASQDEALRGPVSEALAAIRDCELLGSSMNLLSSSHNLQIKLGYFEARVRSMLDASTPGFFFGSNPVLEGESAERGKALLARIRAEIAIEAERTGAVGPFLQRAAKVRALGREFLDFEQNDFQHALLVKHQEQVDREVGRERAIVSWVKDTSFDAIGWYIKFQSRMLGPTASKMSSASVKAGLCAMEKGYVRWRMSSGQVEPTAEQVAADLKECIMEDLGAGAGITRPRPEFQASLNAQGNEEVSGLDTNAGGEGVLAPSAPDSEEGHYRFAPGDLLESLVSPLEESIDGPIQRAP